MYTTCARAAGEVIATAAAPININNRLNISGSPLRWRHQKGV